MTPEEHARQLQKLQDRIEELQARCADFEERITSYQAKIKRYRRKIVELKQGKDLTALVVLASWQLVRFAS